MFRLTKPCKTCPFRRSNGPNFALSEERIREIVEAPAFQCHSTVDYDNWEDTDMRVGEQPQQCAGLMVLLHRERKPNQIMQVGERLGFLDITRIRPLDTYDSLQEAIEAHSTIVRK